MAVSGPPVPREKRAGFTRPTTPRTGCRLLVAPQARLPVKEARQALPVRLTRPSMTQPIEPILIPRLRIRLAEFPYATLFYAPETAHLGDLMRIKYGHVEAYRG